MTDTIIVAVLSLVGTVIGSLAGIMAANRLTVYRIEQLEKKVDKQNNVIERIYALEKSMAEIETKIEMYHRPKED